MFLTLSQILAIAMTTGDFEVWQDLVNKYETDDDAHAFQEVEGPLQEPSKEDLTFERKSSKQIKTQKATILQENIQPLRNVQDSKTTKKSIDRLQSIQRLPHEMTQEFRKHLGDKENLFFHTAAQEYRDGEVSIKSDEKRRTYFLLQQVLPVLSELFSTRISMYMYTEIEGHIPLNRIQRSFMLEWPNATEVQMGNFVMSSDHVRAQEDDYIFYVPVDDFRFLFLHKDKVVSHNSLGDLDLPMDFSITVRSQGVSKAIPLIIQIF